MRVSSTPDAYGPFAKALFPPQALMPGWLYVLVMTVMGVAELLFNATAFRLIESGQDYQS